MKSFKLNNKFYTKKAIEDTIKAFKDVTTIRIEDNSYKILFKEIDNDADKQLPLEFSNYCLGLLK